MNNDTGLDPLQLEAAGILGNTVRVRILRHLRDEGPATRRVLADDLGVPVQSVQRHLALMAKRGVIKVSLREPTGDDLHRRVYDRDAGRVADLIEALRNAVE